MTTRYGLTLVLFCFILIGCSSQRTEVENRTITNVEGVFYHEEGRYTFMVREGDRLVPFTYNNAGHTGHVEIFTDVPDGHAMWVRVYTTDGNGYRESDLSMHIHSIHDLNGAGWNHGKFGRGTTTRIAP